MFLETAIKLPKEIQLKILMEYWLNRYEDNINNTKSLMKSYYEMAEEHCKLYRDIIFYRRKINIFDDSNKKDCFANSDTFESIRAEFVIAYEKSIENKKRLFYMMNAKLDIVKNNIIEKKNIKKEITKLAHLINEKELCKKRITVIRKNERDYVFFYEV